MTEKRGYPFLVGGAILAGSIGLLDILNHTLGDSGLWMVLLASAGGAVFLLWRKPQPKVMRSPLPQTVDTVAVRRALAEAEKVITQLGVEVSDPQEVAFEAVKPQMNWFQAQVSQIASDMNRDDIRLLVMGAKGSGKTRLIQEMQTLWTRKFTRPLSFVEAPSLFEPTENGLAAEALAQQQAIAADLILFLVNGDLTDPEFQMVKRLSVTKRVLLVLNKQDQYLPAERQTLVNQLQRRGRGVWSPEDVVAIAAAPNPIKVRQYQPDGSVKEWLEEQTPDIAALAQRLEQILQQESQQLVLKSSFASAQALGVQVKTVLNDVRRTRALPVVEQFQWIAAGTAIASPLPAMDLVATVAINAQMIHDLGTIYRQKFSLQQAQKVATTLGSLMLKLGLVELSTQAIASLLKSNALTYLAGGCIQGISAAYLTRVAGLSLIEYFNIQEPNLTLSEASPLVIERFSQILQRVFQQNQQLTFLQTLANQAMDRFSAALPQPQLAAASDPALFTSPPVADVSTDDDSVSSEPLKMPLYCAAPLSAAPEVEIPAQNGTGIPLAASCLDTTHSSD